MDRLASKRRRAEDGNGETQATPGGAAASGAAATPAAEGTPPAPSAPQEPSASAAFENGLARRQQQMGSSS
eukprot:8530648-Pyramimonas_sp.AAC.1